MDGLESLEVVKVNRDGGVVTVLLSRPKALNAINEQMWFKRIRVRRVSSA